MHCHPNAPLTPRGRAKVFRAVEAGLTVSAACQAAGVSRRWYYRWRSRWQNEGEAGLLDASSRPRHSPQQLSEERALQVLGLRLALGWSADRIGPWLGLPRSTVHRAIHRLGLVKAKAPPAPARRYVYHWPGGLLHVDIKKLGRIGDGPGHRAHGDRRTRHRGVGWEYLYLALDDASRLVYCELLPDETGLTASGFLLRALRWFKSQGVAIYRLLTDNGSPFLSRRWRRTCWRLGIRHLRTKPYHPQTNGKAERWIRTALSECLYLEVFHSPEQRRLALERFVRYYNDVRPHLGLHGLTPRRLLELRLAA